MMSCQVFSVLEILVDLRGQIGRDFGVKQPFKFGVTTLPEYLPEVAIVEGLDRREFQLEDITLAAGSLDDLGRGA